MKPTKIIETEVLKVYDAWLESYLNGDIETYDSFLAEDYRFIGSTNNEDYLNRKETTKFFKETADQLSGKAELKNLERSIEVIEKHLVLFTDLADAYVLSGSDWVFYSRFRFTSLMKKTKNGWRFTYQHFSAPDNKAQDGETLGTEQISKENQELRDAIKRRTAELEHSNTELAIEAALERVRARTMAMQHSNELQDAAFLMFQQIEMLGISAFGCGFNIWDKDKKASTAWMAGENRIQPPFKTLSSKDIFVRIHAAEINGDTLFVEEQSGKELKAHYKYMISIPEFKEIVDGLVDKGYSLPSSQIMHCAYFSQGYLMFISFEPVPEAHAIFKRFANVFEQTYTRFLDLKKAEAQSKEAQIELGLERVRASAMAMQSTNELSDLVGNLLHELTKLDFSLTFCIINIVNEPDNSNMVWAANPEEGKAPESYYMKFEDYPFHHAMMREWKAQTPKFIYVMEGEEKEIYDDYLYTDTEFRRFPKEVQTANRALDKYVSSFVFSKFGGLQTVGDQPLSDENLDILYRFGKVFDLTYTRFNDLQKAEAQAREAQIELALERVRARTMAMYKSEELKEVIQVVFEQLLGLNFQIEHAGFIIDYKENDDMHIWLTDQHEVPSKVVLPYFNCAHWNSFNEAKKNGLDFFTNHLDFKAKNKFYKDLFKLIPDVPKETLKFYHKCPGLAISTVLLDNIGLYIENFEGIPYSTKENDTLMRFGKVFQQTYTRFLDLQKAEAQAREAQIENALEKVRSRTMAMQKSEELPEAANNLFLQLQELGLPAWSAGYCIWQDEKKNASCNMSTEGQIQKSFVLPSIGEGYDFYSPYKNGESFYIHELGGKALVKHYDFMLTLPVVGEILDGIKESGYTLPTFQIFHIVYFKFGYVMFITYESMPHAHDIFKRFGKVFEQTYTRFLDLQKAEEQTREAQINLAVERVRAKALAMHKSEEIMEVVAKLKDEVMNLDIPDVVAATIFLKEGDENVRMWDLSSLEKDEDGYEIPFDITFKLKKSDPNLYVKRVWENPENYFLEIQESKDLKRIVSWLRENNKNAIADEVQQHTKSIKLKRLYHAVKKLNNGKLAIDLLSHPSDEMETILTKMGAAFDLAYKRFEDLQKAEAQTREAEIELAVERIRARTMGMQHSDELAEISSLLDNQVRELGIKTRGCAFNIYGKNDSTEWFSSEEGTLPSYKTPRENVFLRYYEAGQRGESLYIEEFADEACAAHYDYLMSLPVTGEGLRQFKENGGSFPSRQIDHVAFFKYGYLLFITLEPVPEAHHIFQRFALVFEQTYTRFLDLKKAETQARQAQIEAALEKVRSRSLAMHVSTEMQKVADEISQQLLILGFDIHALAMSGVIDEESDYEVWVGGANFEKPLLIPYNNDTKVQSDYNKAIKERPELFTKTYTGKVKDAYFKHLMATNTFTAELKKMMLECSAFTTTLTFMKNSGIQIIRYNDKVFSHEDNSIIKRFGRVFEQAYIRFLDLQKAEAQTKEARIEAALERVRSRSMAMHKSEELLDVISVVSEQLEQLGFKFIHVSFANNDMSKDYKFWTAYNGMTKPARFNTPYLELAVFKNLRKAQENSTAFYSDIITNEEHVKWHTHLLEHGGSEIFSKEENEFIMSRGMARSIAINPNIMLILANYASIPYSDDENRIIERFGKVFEQSYTRFLDLQKAEEQAVVAEHNLMNLKAEKKRAEEALAELQHTQKQLIQSEKMASLGELTAGIAHEIQNPLNFVNNFSEVSNELIEEMSEEIDKGDLEEVKFIMADIKSNLEKINHHGKRADAIVKGMLQHSRTSSAEKEPTDINKLADEYLRLAYHGLRAKDKSFNAHLETDYDDSIGKIAVIPQDIGRVILNLITNAFYACNEKKKSEVENYEPTVTVSTKKSKNKITVSVKDNGNGIPKHVIEKVFQPFFTTKPTGQGTGLGLSMSYDIVKAHGGELTVETEVAKGTLFIIQLSII